MPAEKPTSNKQRVASFLCAIYTIVIFTLLFLLGISNLTSLVSWAMVIASVLVVLYFPLSILHKKYPTLITVLLIVDTFAVGTILISSLISVRSFQDLVISLAFVPAVLAFILPLKEIAADLNEKIKEATVKASNPITTVTQVPEAVTAEINNQKRRQFIKLMISAGVGTTFLLLTGRRKAEAAFFGSVPGTGTIAIKDSAGTKIDPAIKSPTDSYGITDIFNSAYPYYFGFVHYNGTDWYILKQESLGAFSYASRYNNASVNYSTAWSTKASTLVYGTFSNAFMLP